MENMDTVSLQAVTLSDGSTAYIQHESKASFSDGQIMDGQVIQLEDGSAAYVQHVSVPKAGTVWPPASSSLSDKGCTVMIWIETRYLFCFVGSVIFSVAWFNRLLYAAGGDSLQLEDGQAVQLEDGTTAYIHTPKGKH